jgi:transposase
VVGVEQWAEIRRMHRVERLSIREISKRTGLHRKTIRRALGADAPPRYSRAPGVSKLDPFREWICEQLQAEPRIQSLRLREMAGECGVYDSALCSARLFTP